MFGAQQTDQGYARSPNGTGDFVIKDPTFNENNDNAVGVEQIQMEVSELVLYPNPAKHSIQIEFKSVDNKPMLVKIYNSLGVCISEKSIDQNGSIDCSNWARGMYHVKVGNIVRPLILL